MLELKWFYHCFAPTNSPIGDRSINFPNLSLRMETFESEVDMIFGA